MLATLGVDETAERVYWTMLANPDWGLDELAVRLDLTGKQIQVSLDDLFALALVRESFDHPDRFRVLDPGAGLLSALARQHEDLDGTPRRHQPLRGRAQGRQERLDLNAERRSRRLRRRAPGPVACTAAGYRGAERLIPLAGTRRL